jgi:hypothetical protein
VSSWHSVADSDAIRWITKRGPTRAVFRSGLYRRANTERLRMLAVRGARSQAGRFDEVAAYCAFVGHNKAGSSMLGGLLDAHPDVILSDEADALRFVQEGFEREPLFWLLDRRSRLEARSGRITARRLEPYSYAVSGGSQGRSDRPRVVGDSTTGTSTRRLGTDPDLLHRLARVMGTTEVKLVHIVRNPFDPISVMMVRGARTFRNSIDHFFTACDMLVDIRQRVAPGSLHVVRHEDFVENPEQGLERTCRFLGVDADAGYLRHCAAIIRRTPDRSRDMVGWTPEWISEVQDRLTAYDFLAGYSYEG